MHLSFIEELKTGTITLNTEESLHVSKVLRLKNQDQLKLTDGKGNSATGTITAAAKKNVTIKIEEVVSEKTNPYFLELAMAPTKGSDKFELVLEKCTELGINKFTPLLTYHSERRKVNLERSQKIIMSAMKQSQKVWLPEISVPVKFADFVTQEFNGKKLIAHCSSDISRESLKKYCSAEPTLICIGPEGDFSDEEISLAEKNGFTSVSLGNERLRTETAAIFATAIYHTITSL